MSLLTADNLTISIAGKLLFQGLNLRLEAGQVWGILGSNGIGKSTLLHTLAGIHSPDAGIIRIQNSAISSMSRREVARKLGIIFQSQYDAFPATVLETTLTGRHPFLSRWQWESAADIETAKSALMDVELDTLQNRTIGTLSGGEKQRLKIANLLTQDPLISLLDEPTNHLDLRHQIKLLNLLCDRNRERDGTMLMVLHDINLAARYCTHIMLIVPNEMPEMGTAQEILQPDKLECAYRWPIGVTQDSQYRLYYPG